MSNPITSSPNANLSRFSLEKTDRLISNLKSNVKSMETPEELEKNAKQFEAIFINQLLDEMDKSVNREGSLLSGGESEKSFRGLMYQEIATMAADRPLNQGFGIAKAVYEQTSRLLPGSHHLDPMSKDLVRPIPLDTKQ
ncbi:MAG: rod-binding protein [Vampirovibrionales bacterium]|nr:rod-binding protein [Vampirovibrionales bacterium]